MRKKGKTVLDEREMQEMYRIEHRGLWLMYGLLCAAVVIQMLLGAPLAQMAGELIVVMAVSIVMIVSNARHGIWDESARPSVRGNAQTALLAGAAVAAVVAVVKRNVLLGLGAGFFYALYSIFGRYAVNRGYSSWTITFYTFLFCALGGAFLTDWTAIGLAVRQDRTVLLWIPALAVFTAFLPYVLYAAGLRKMESSRASILASVEPVVCALVSVLVFREPIGFGGIAGVLLVLTAIAVLSLEGKRRILEHSVNNSKEEL